MLKVLVSCANGAGTSLMAKMTAEKVFKKLNLQATLHHCSISEGKSAASQYDVVLCSLNFVNMFKNAQDKGVKIIGLKNVMSQQEMEEKIIEAGIV